MAYKDMQVANVQDGGSKGFAFEASDELSSVTNGKWIIIPDDVRNVAVTFSNTDSAVGKVQATTDSIASVKDDSAVGVDWDDGAVAVPTQAAVIPVTAIRLVQTTLGGGTGTTKLTVRAQ